MKTVDKLLAGAVGGSLILLWLTKDEDGSPGADARRRQDDYDARFRAEYDRIAEAARRRGVSPARFATRMANHDLGVRQQRSDIAREQTYGAVQPLTFSGEPATRLTPGVEPGEPPMVDRTPPGHVPGAAEHRAWWRRPRRGE